MATGSVEATTPMSLTMGASLKGGQSQAGETSVMKFTNSERSSFPFKTPRVYSTIFSIKTGMDAFHWICMARFGHTKIHSPQPMHFSAFIRAFFSLIGGNRARYGGFLAHIGIMLITLGIVASSFYSVEKTETLDVGETMNVGDYELTYNELLFSQDNTKVSAVADITVRRDGRTLGAVRPSFDYWFSHQDSFAEVAVRTTPAEDLFVSLIWTGYNPEDKSAAFRVLVNPLVVWIWVGGGFFLLGGAVSFTAKIKEKP